MNFKNFLLLLLLLNILGFQGIKTARAQDNFTPEPPPVVSPPVRRDEGLDIAYQHVEVTIKDQVAITHVDQLFVNNNDWLLEGTYLFPLPQDASVSQLTMWVNGQPIDAKILQKEEARDIYDTIVRQLRDPALLEYVGSSVVQANVFPIPPNEERRVEIEYSQILPVENGLVHYIYPQSTDLYTNAPLDSQSIRVDLASDEPIHAIYSPSHAVAINRDGEYRAVAGYEADQVTANEDFELYYTVTAQEIGLNLLTYREPAEDGFFMLLVAPKVEAKEIVAKDVILVLDTSGSMEGQKLQQAKDAAIYIVEHLQQQDRFNIISFSTGIRRYEPDLLQSGDAGEVQSFINGLDAVGGTNISAALLEAAGQADGERPTTIIFVTDGLATEGITDTPLLLDAVSAAMPKNARIFAFGVGNDVDPDLLDNLAQNHRGTTTYVRPDQKVDEAVSSFYAEVSSPVLSDISLDYDGIVVEQTYPQVLPDLFAGTQLVVAGRYRTGGPATITLSGEVNGSPQRSIYNDNFFRTSDGDEFIPRLWATRATGHLLRQIRLHGENDELVKSVVDLSIRYGIITPYTSYLIEEEDIFSQAGRNAIIEEEILMAGDSQGFALEVEVEAAAVQADMAAAEAPMRLPLPTISAADVDDKRQANLQQLVEYVGSKTFVFRDEVWMDTSFVEERHSVKEISFAADEYFDLLIAAPEIGQYLALGQQVLLVHDDQAYRIVSGEEESLSTMPDPQEVGQLDQVVEEEVVAFSQVGVRVTPEEKDAPSALQPNLCASLLVFPAILALGGIVSWTGRRRMKS